VILICQDKISFSINKKVERERVVTEDMVRSWDRAEFDRQFHRLEEENQALQRQVENLQSGLNESEQQHAQR
jgi:hypothetical protein